MQQELGRGGTTGASCLFFLLRPLSRHRPPQQLFSASAEPPTPSSCSQRLQSLAHLEKMAPFYVAGQDYGLGLLWGRCLIVGIFSHGGFCDSPEVLLQGI